MKKLFIFLRSATACALAAFLLLSPARLAAELERNPYREFLGGGNEERWSGIVTLWHVVEFKSYQGSVTAFLESCASSYEKQNPGVYIEVVGLSPDTAFERIQRGEKPDIWSLPMGALSMADLMTLSGGIASTSLADGLRPYMREDAVKAMPYLMSGYYLIGNTNLIQSLGLSFPTIEQKTSGEMEEILQSAVVSKSTTRFGALCAPYVLAARLNITGNLASDGDFKAGQVPFMIGDARALGDIQRKKDSFTLDILPLGGYTQEVQFIGIDMGVDKERAAHCESFIELALSNERQLKLTALGSIPAIELSEPPAYTDSILSSLYDAYKNPIIPDPALYSSERDMLNTDAQNAVAGDISAKESFKKRMAEMTE